MLVNDKEIFSKNVVKGNNTIKLTDDELDNIYKQYVGNSLIATFNLSGSGYNNTKTCTIIFKGNHKTGHIKISNIWKRTQKWVKVDGKWYKCTRWINQNGKWKRCI